MIINRRDFLDNKDLKSLSSEEIREVFLNMGEKAFRGDQAFKWIHKNLVNSIDDISELSKDLRDKLKNNWYISNLKIFRRLDSQVDNTKKYLFSLRDGNIIESVMMEYKHGVSVCISTQVGCRMGCSFCASTKGGLVRNLTPGEIVDQIYSIQKDIGIPVKSIVLMGSGEPLDNFDNVMKFMDIIHDKKGQNLGYRHVTLSTCGIVPKIYELAEYDIPITLSISLHSPYEDERKKIMPIGNRYSIKEIIEACIYYINKTCRRITFEYTLIKGVNDSIKDAEAIAELLKGLLCHVNLIPLNPIKEASYTKSTKNSVVAFKDLLEKRGITATIRREMGTDVNAACGQLRIDYMKESEF